MYSAVTLKDSSQKRLINAFKSYVPEGWRIYAHHMTIVFGKPLPNPVDQDKEVMLTITHIGISDKAIALKVKGYPSENKIPHITLAIARDEKPFLSNLIKRWHKVAEVKVYGYVSEIRYA